MDLALTMAEKTIGQTSPNPSVGAVVVKDGRILGIGTHLQAGKAHAEVHALEQAGEDAEGADIYVTLEPCAHHGKTPPCADLIIERKVKKAYIACLDPNPDVAGKGVEKLQKAGIDVEIGIQEARALELNRKFFHFIQRKQPFVTLKAAMTLDGKIATSSGDSKWVTSEQAREDVHYQRSIHDAILVGINTVLQDNPQLTTRLPQGGKNPIRIVLDTHLKINENVHVLNQEAPTWIICGLEADATEFSKQYPHVDIIQMTSKQINLDDVLSLLGERKIQSLYVEGGSAVHRSFIDNRLFQVIHWYIAPKLLGGSDAFTPIGGSSPAFMNEAVSLEVTSLEQIGPDIKVTAHPRKEKV